MKETKQLFLYLVGAAIVIIAIGMFNNKSQGKPLVGNWDFPSKTNTSQTYKKIQVKDIDLSVRVADDNNERKIGLSQTISLPDSEGMLFVFDQENQRPIFWMKDMKMAIDIIWINDGKVVQIDRNVRPEPGKKDSELTKYKSAVGVDYVLETAEGLSDRKNIKVGDLVQI